MLLMMPAGQVLQVALKVQIVHALTVHGTNFAGFPVVIRKLKSGEYRLLSRNADAKTGKHKNLGTFTTREEAEKREGPCNFSSARIE
jgi:hypothetical protein